MEFICWRHARMISEALKRREGAGSKTSGFQNFAEIWKIVIDEGFWQIPLSISAWLYRKMASPDRSDEEIDEGMDVDEAGEGDHFLLIFLINYRRWLVCFHEVNSFVCVHKHYNWSYLMEREATLLLDAILCLFNRYFYVHVWWNCCGNSLWIMAGGLCSFALTMKMFYFWILTRGFPVKTKHPVLTTWLFE